MAAKAPYLAMARRFVSRRANHHRSLDMNAKQPSQPEATGEATRGAVIAGAILPGAMLQGSRDGSSAFDGSRSLDGLRPLFRDDAREADESGRPKESPGHVHAAFTGLLALGTIALLALGR